MTAEDHGNSLLGKLSPIVTSINSLYAWGDSGPDSSCPAGSLGDCAAKLAALERFALVDEGVELLLFPRRIDPDAVLPDSAIDTIRTLPWCCTHIGDSEYGFLLDPDISSWLSRLFSILTRLHCTSVVLHASHFRQDTDRCAEILRKHLPDIKIVVENNGGDCRWGYDIENIKNLLAANDDFLFCLDIAHLKEVPQGHSLREVVGDAFLPERITQVHYSYSTAEDEGSVYEAKGFSGYTPKHAFFSLAPRPPSRETMDFISRYPAVMEGMLPLEDSQMNLLRQERAQLRGT